MIELSERRIPAPPWTAVHSNVGPPQNPEALVDAAPIIRQLRIALGDVRAARLLGLDPLVWIAHQGRDPVGPDLAFRALELYDVLARALRIFDAATAMRWLGEPEPYRR